MLKSLIQQLLALVCLVLAARLAHRAYMFSGQSVADNIDTWASHGAACLILVFVAFALAKEAV